MVTVTVTTATVTVTYEVMHLYHIKEDLRNKDTG